MIEESQSLMEIIEHYPHESEINIRRRQTILKNIGKGLGFIKALKMISCSHDNGKGHETGLAWIKDLDDNRKVIRSFKEVTKRCDYCNQVFYRKRYNLRKKRR